MIELKITEQKNTGGIEMIDIKKEIVKTALLTKQLDFVTVGAIFKEFNINYKGEYSLISNEFKNITIWGGWSMEALNIINELLSNRVLILEIINPNIYVLFGTTLKLPIANAYKDYHEMHWLPMVLIPDINAQNYIES